MASRSYDIIIIISWSKIHKSKDLIPYLQLRSGKTKTCVNSILLVLCTKLGCKIQWTVKERVREHDIILLSGLSVNTIYLIYMGVSNTLKNKLLSTIFCRSEKHGLQRSPCAHIHTSIDLCVHSCMEIFMLLLQSKLVMPSGTVLDFQSIVKGNQNYEAATRTHL